MNLRVVALASSFVAAVSAPVITQQPQLPARDVPRQQTATPGTGAIAGIVRAADTGLPIRGVDIRLLGTGAPGRVLGAFTGADGRYEFTGLPDGAYTLVASKVRYMTMTYGQTRPGEEGRTVQVSGGQRAGNVDFLLPTGAVIVLRVGNRYGDPAVGYEIELYQARVNAGQRGLARFADVGRNVTDDRGEVRLSGLPPGEYYASAFLNLPPPLAASAEGEVRTFYPGTPAEADAQPITVGLGEEVVHAFNAVVSRTSRISGSVIGGGRPDLRLERRTPLGMTIVDILLSVASDGSFSRPNLYPGEYVLTARTATEMGTLTFPVGTEDVSGLVVTMRPVQPIRGRVTFDGAAPQGVAQTAFVVRPALENNGIAYVAQYQKADWTFEIPALSGSGVIRAELPRGWFLKAVLLDGRNVTDTVLDFETYLGKTINVVVTQTASEIRGGAVDDAGRAVPNYVAVVFPEEQQRWTSLTRAIASARPDQQGRFSLRGLPPGRYLVAAVDYLQPGQERDPKTLERLRSRATAITLTEGATQTVTVPLIP
jgi:hypothetical protein